jgi:uncharacterized peroxidase-related enzyme
MTARLKPVTPESATGEAKAALDAVQSRMGRVPNTFQLMANSPAALKAYLAFSDQLSKGLLDAQMRERIAIAVAETHGCEYCLSAHVAIGKSVGLSDDELMKARQQQSSDPKADAAMSFVRDVLVRKGSIIDADLEEARTAGLTDGEIVELVANLALNIFTNYFNLVSKAENDFPPVKLAFPV